MEELYHKDCRHDTWYKMVLSQFTDTVKSSHAEEKQTLWGNVFTTWLMCMLVSAG